MTLSAMGDAETPAGGSVCIRYVDNPSAAAQDGAPCVIIQDQKGVQGVGVGDLLGESTLKSRIRRRRAGVVMFRRWNLNLSLSLGYLAVV